MPGKQHHVTRSEFIKACLEKGKAYVPSGTKRAVLCVETGVVYKSQKDAARALGILPECVRASCARSVTHTGGGHYNYRDKCVYHFRYHEMPHEDDGHIWKPIVLFGGMFEASEMGQIRRASTGQIVNGRVNKDTGQVSVRLVVASLTHHFLVGPLVADAFMPEHAAGAVAMHIDGDTTNNCLSNLRWGTMKDVANTLSMKAKISLSQRTSERVLAYRNSPQAAAVRRAFEEYGKSIRKQVICEETGVVYDSIEAAAKAVGVNRCTVVSSCKRKESRFGVREKKGKPVLHFRWYNPDDPESNKKRHIATTQDYMDRVAHMRRPVRCLETGVIYESVSAAAKAFGKCTSNLSRMCKQPDSYFVCYFRKSKVIYHFQYADEK